jgi:DNA-binding CsgD family transcriptional regulator
MRAKGPDNPMRRHEGGKPDEAVWAAANTIAFAVAQGESAAVAGQEIMDAIASMVGADFASILTMTPELDWAVRGHVGGAADHDLLASRYTRYSTELTSAELSELAGGFRDAQNLFPTRRRERLAIFREFLGPRGLHQVVCGAWLIDHRAWVIGMTRTRSAFPARALARLNALVPHLAAAFRALTWHPQSATAVVSPGRQGGNLAMDGRWELTPAQARVADLVVRGLTNREIGRLLGTSQNTVRNTLAEVFQKVGVSRRAELAFVVATGTAREDPRKNVEVFARARALVTLRNAKSFARG